MENSIFANMLKTVKPAVTADFKSAVSICNVAFFTVQHLESLNVVVDSATVKMICAEIRKNREVSTIALFPDNIAFNPKLTVTGTNCRLFPVYFQQKLIDCIPSFINPLDVVAPPADVVADVVAVNAPPLLIEYKPTTTTNKGKGGKKK